MRTANDQFKTSKNLKSARLIFLYQITYDEAGNGNLYWTNYGKNIPFEGHTFEPYIIQHDRIDEDLTGKATGMTLKIANVNRFIHAIHDNYNLIGKQVRVVTICEEEMSDPNAYIEDLYRVVDIVINKQEMTLRLSSPFDVMDLRIPRRYFFRGYCRFRFKGAECQYSGIAGDCDKTLQRCRELENTGHFGAFPAIPDQRLMLR